MKKFFALIFVLFMCPTSAFAQLEPFTQSEAFKRYESRHSSELSRLIYLLERFNIPGIEIKIDGNSYPAEVAFPFAKLYLALNYRKERAEVWLQKHCYRSPFTNQVMLGRLPGEKLQPGRDMLFTGLKELREFEKNQKNKKH